MKPIIDFYAWFQGKEDIKNKEKFELIVRSCLKIRKENEDLSLELIRESKKILDVAGVEGYKTMVDALEKVAGKYKSTVCTIIPDSYNIFTQVAPEEVDVNYLLIECIRSRYDAGVVSETIDMEEHRDHFRNKIKTYQWGRNILLDKEQRERLGIG